MTLVTSAIRESYSAGPSEDSGPESLVDMAWQYQAALLSSAVGVVRLRE